MIKVYVVGYDYLVMQMFHLHSDYEVVQEAREADLIVFTGGSDVSPGLYGEKAHATTYSDPNRDRIETSIFTKNRTTPKVGMCRGAQFLNVMNGGRLWQHVERHALRGKHGLTRLDVDNRHAKTYYVTSTHHQMMRPTDEAIVLAKANWVDNVETVGEQAVISGIEVVFYSETNSLCFQPHPEYDMKGETYELFFEYINKFLFGGE